MTIDLRRASLFLLAVALTTSCGSGDSPEPPLIPSTSPPVPVATAPPVSAGGCKLGLPKGTGPGVNCPRTEPTLMRVMEDAVNTVRMRNADAYPIEAAGFRLTDKQLDAFFKDVVDHINAGGEACAYRDGLELALKSTNAFSEQFKFWITSGHIRLGGNAYRATCSPAWF